MVLRSGVCEKYPEEHVPYLLKIRRYGEDTDTVRSEGEDTVEDTKIRSKIRTLSDRKEKIRSKIRRYGRRYQDTVEDTKIRRTYGDSTGSTNVQGAAHLISEPFGRDEFDPSRDSDKKW